MDAYAVPPAVYRYRDLGRVTSFLQAVVWLHIVASLLLFASSTIFGLLHIRPPAATVDKLAGTGFTVVLLAEFGLLFFWLYRAAANVHAMGADITFTPGWAIGWLMIPIITLWMSFVVVEEIWRSSIDAKGWRERHAGWAAIHWWLAWDAMYVTGIAYGLTKADVFAIAAFAAQAIYAFLLLPVIARIRDLQQTQASMLGLG